MEQDRSRLCRKVDSAKGVLSLKKCRVSSRIFAEPQGRKLNKWDKICNKAVSAAITIFDRI